MIFFNLPYIKKKDLANLWVHGFIKINRIGNVQNVGSYVSKYMGKDFLDDRLLGQKSYFCSRGLKQPEIIFDDVEIELILSSVEIERKILEAIFESVYSGLIRYYVYMI